MVMLQFLMFLQTVECARHVTWCGCIGIYQFVGQTKFVGLVHHANFVVYLKEYYTLAF
jgi:hypothetical protein